MYVNVKLKNTCTYINRSAGVNRQQQKIYSKVHAPALLVGENPSPVTVKVQPEAETPHSLNSPQFEHGWLVYRRVQGGDLKR